ncbi:MAG: hypothetical protein JRF63_01710 [Deltaproteobacteria bacterium]|nr:hypothetical protein [Deltaproteobacteria bacterium]
MSDKKTEDRPYMGLGVFQPDGDAAPGTTIVGGQPDGQRRKGVVSVPVGMEQLLLTAAVDADFRAELIRDRAEAAERRGLELTDSERAVLAIAPDDQLETMIARIDTSEQNLKKRKFMRAVAATVVTLAAGTGLGACGGPEDKAGGNPNAPFEGPVDTSQVEIPQPEPMPPTGIRPDMIPEPAPPVAGALAQEPDASVAPTVDMPIEKPRPTKGIRPDFGEPPNIEDVILKPPKVDVKPPKAPTRGHTKH